VHNYYLGIARFESPFRASKAVNFSLVRNTGDVMKDAIKKWWEGEFESHRNDRTSDTVIVGPGSCRRHWTSRTTHWAVDFYMREWKWTLGALAAVVSVVFFKKF
jgi:hypothetical protein